MSEVKKLWRTNSATLGFFPDGAFFDYADKRQILVAVTESDSLIGYLIYRVTKQRISIVHLCVDSSARKQGIAKLLVDFLKQNTKNSYGIGLYCRRDFEANKIWPSLGFYPIHEKRGKSKTGKSLNYWWFDHGHPSLLTIVNDLKLQAGISAIIDANVFFDLQDPNNENPESKALLADWLQDSLVLCLTKEIFNEIERNENKLERIKCRNFANSFPLIEADSQKIEETKNKLLSFYPPTLKNSDYSDIRHLAHAINKGIRFFVTRDQKMLDLSEQIYSSFELRIMRPSNLISYIDELIKEEEYRPSRLAGSWATLQLLKSEQDNLVIDSFLCNSLGEPKKNFKSNIYNFLANPDTYKSFIITFKKQPVGLIVYRKKNEYELEIPLFRLANINLAPTFARYLAQRCILDAYNNNKIFVKVTEPYLTEKIKNALADCFFIFSATNKEWIKVILRDIKPVKKISKVLIDLRN